MMPQAWFEMAEIRRRKFAASAWIPLRAVQPICEQGNRCHLGFKDEFFGAGSLAVPVALKDKATKLGWSDVGISHEHRACVDDDSIDIAALQEIAAPPKSEKWGSLKSLEKVLATVCSPEEARRALTPLVGTYQLRLADAHLPGSELAEAIKLAGIDGSSPALHQGQTLIANCASAAMAIATLLERLIKSEHDKGNKNG